MQLVEAFVLLEDVDGVMRVIERGGPSGWQVVRAVRSPLSVLVERRSEVLSELIARVTACELAPGVVAGRDASAPGLHVGEVVLRPSWLAFERPRPVDTLRMLRELGTEAPQWDPKTRP